MYDAFVRFFDMLWEDSLDVEPTGTGA